MGHVMPVLPKEQGEQGALFASLSHILGENREHYSPHGPSFYGRTGSSMRLMVLRVGYTQGVHGGIPPRVVYTRVCTGRYPS